MSTKTEQPDQAFAEPSTRNPVLTFLGAIGEKGNLSLVTPMPVAWLPQVIIGMIDYAEDLHKRGQTDKAIEEVKRIEARLKITDEDRAAAMRPWEEWELALDQILAEHIPDEAPDGATVLPEDIGRFTPSEEKELDAALDRLRRARTAGNRELEADKIKKIRQRPRQRVDNAWRSATVKEIADLAELRGDTVEMAETKGGRTKPMRRQSGLDWLWSKGRTTEHQMDAGLRYGDDVRTTTDVSIKSFLNDSGGGGADGALDHREKARKRLVKARVEGLNGHQEMIRLCDLICGDGERIRSIVGGGDVETQRTEAVFLVALDLLVAHYGLARS